MPEGLRSKSGLKYALSFFNKVKEGIGKSKREQYIKNGGYTPYIHNYKTFTRYYGVAKEFTNFAIEKGINRLDKLNNDIVNEFLSNKIKQGFTRNTIELNISALKKYFNTIGREDLTKYLTDNYYSFTHSAKEGGQVLAFTNAERVIETLRKEEFKIIAKIEYYTGARISDVKKISFDDDNYAIKITSSKGGRDRTLDFSDRVERYNQVRELYKEYEEKVKPIWKKEIKLEYYKDLKYACRKLGEIYTGSHSFRANYAVERWKYLEEQINVGILTMEQAEKVLTEELGHSRREMAVYYRNK